MEVALGVDIRIIPRKVLGLVLILIVVEVALGAQVEIIDYSEKAVLILILVEVALGTVPTDSGRVLYRS